MVAFALSNPWADPTFLAIMFLASDQSAWITGVILDVAGGAVMIC